MTHQEYGTLVLISNQDLLPPATHGQRKLENHLLIEGYITMLSGEKVTLESGYRTCCYALTAAGIQALEEHRGREL